MFGQLLLYPTIPFIVLDRWLASVNSSYLIESMTLGKEMWEMGREGALISSSPRGHFHCPCTSKLECPLSTVKSDSRTRENIFSTDIRSFLILGKEQCDKKFQLIGMHKRGNQCDIFSLVSRKQVFVDKAGKSTGKRKSIHKRMHHRNPDTGGPTRQKWLAVGFKK